MEQNNLARDSNDGEYKYEGEFKTDSDGMAFIVCGIVDMEDLNFISIYQLLPM